MPNNVAKKALVENWKWGYAAHITPGIGYAIANFIGHAVSQHNETAAKALAI